MSNPHIVKAFENELNKLNNSLVAMGHVVASQVERALMALRQRDSTIADAVVYGDAAVDAAEHGVDEAVVTLLALRNPVADDLRLVLATSKIAGQLERIGDIAANLGKRATVLASLPDVALAKECIAMGDVAYGILADTLAAFAERDVALAYRVRERDVVIDEAHTKFQQNILAHMMHVSTDVPQCAHLLFAGKNIERIGDHATNIAEMTVYLATGQWPSEARIKHDFSSSLDSPA